MSIYIKTSEIDTEKVADDLHIELPVSKYAKNQAPQYVYPYRLTSNDDLFIPFGYGMKLLDTDKRPTRDSFKSSKFKFNGTLRPHQEQIKKEALHHLNRGGSVMISAYPGCGKCLKFDTPVVMFDGLIKSVQNVAVGDLLMGDDSTERKVLSLARGQEQMYDIIPENGDTFGCNASHILSLKSMSSEGIVDISVLEYLSLPEHVKDDLRLYRVPVEFPERETYIRPYIYGTSFGKQDSPRRILDSFKRNSRRNRLELVAGLLDTIGTCNTAYYDIKQSSLSIAHDITYVVRSLGFISTIIRDSNRVYTVRFSGPNSEHIPSISKKTRIPMDDRVVGEALYTKFRVAPIQELDYYGFTIDGNHRFLLGDFTVTHNTITAIKIASTIKLPALVITKGLPIINQWRDSVERFSPDATCQIIKPKTTILEDRNFYVVNAINASKIDSVLLKKIGLVIVDEAHQIMSEVLSKSLTHVTPRYLIGLTATPYRYDGYDSLLGLYFGIDNGNLGSEEGTNPLIYRKLQVPHIVYKIETGFKPIVRNQRSGKA